ncbi:MAG: hypothetical protein Q9177_003826 [Variospora cf. flavescens]
MLGIHNEYAAASSQATAVVECSRNESERDSSRWNGSNTLTPAVLRFDTPFNACLHELGSSTTPRKDV